MRIAFNLSHRVDRRGREIVLVDDRQVFARGSLANRGADGGVQFERVTHPRLVRGKARILQQRSETISRQEPLGHLRRRSADCDPLVVACPVAPSRPGVLRTTAVADSGASEDGVLR